MLNREELNRLSSIQGTINLCKEAKRFPTLGVYDIEWLAAKVDELDEGFRRLLDENEKLNAKMIAMAERDNR